MKGGRLRLLHLFQHGELKIPNNSVKRFDINRLWNSKFWLASCTQNLVNYIGEVNAFSIIAVKLMVRIIANPEILGGKPII